MKVPIDFVWSSLPVPALLIDPKDAIIEINPAAEGFFTWTAPEREQANQPSALDEPTGQQHQHHRDHADIQGQKMWPDLR